MPRTVNLVQPGAMKPINNPYTICIIANPYIESPKGSGNFIADPITHSEQIFNTKVQYILSSLFGTLPYQAETMLAPIAHDFCVVSIFDDGLALADQNTLVAENGDLVEARQDRFANFLTQFAVSGLSRIKADVAFAVTASNKTRSTAWFTYDNDAGDGVPFSIDNMNLFHRHNNIHPGVVALHSSAYSLVALHEFGHAASSWTNGMVIDLYVDQSVLAFNIRQGRPIPSQFARYNNVLYATDPVRAGIGYPANWLSYHCQLTTTHAPAVMDNFWQGNPPEQCTHDAITRRFLMDRVQAIMSRP
jgi:hypothetical protein